MIGENVFVKKHYDALVQNEEEPLAIDKLPLYQQNIIIEEAKRKVTNTYPSIQEKIYLVGRPLNPAIVKYAKFYGIIHYFHIITLIVQWLAHF